MPRPHTIRLNGPWEMITPADEKPRRVKLPAEWPQVMAACSDGPVVLQRWFHRPTGLDEQTAVHLVLTALPCRGNVSLDDTRLGDVAAGQTQAFDVSSKMAPRGCVTLSLEAASVSDETAANGASAPTPEIALSIQPHS